MQAMKPTVDAFIEEHREDSDAELAQALVRATGLGALLTRDAGLDIHQKANIADVVTQADLWAEDFTGTVLRTLRPNDGLLGEEGTDHASDSGRTWVIDPVDGTFNFAAGMDYFCSALALVHGDPADPRAVEFGAVHRPVTNTTWFGGAGLGTTVYQHGDPNDPTAGTRARHLPPLPRGSRAKNMENSGLATYLHPSFYSEPVFDVWRGLVPCFATFRTLGSASIDLAQLSAGVIDAWAQIKVCDWDWLPGRGLIEGVGGTTRKITVQGIEWSLAGTDTVVAEMVEHLERSNS
ncbi:MAG: inositol monophosphatase [Corynebacterium sp.]|nr:inositol monophosphatase [Corynebacterium sp.]